MDKDQLEYFTALERVQIRIERSMADMNAIIDRIEKLANRAGRSRQDLADVLHDIGRQAATAESDSPSRTRPVEP